MQVGIVGHRLSGKTTVFGALTGIEGQSGIASKGKLSLGVIKVPDMRIDELTAIFSPQKTVYADINFIDVPGTDDPQKVDEGIDIQTVAHIRAMDALVLVVRAFGDPSVIHPKVSVDPLRDVRTYEEEMRTTDYIQIESRLERMKKENKKGIEYDVLQRCLQQLENDKPLRQMDFSEPETKIIRGFKFLSQKDLIVLINTDEKTNETYVELSGAVENIGGTTLSLCAKLEYEISQLPSGEQKGFLKEMGIEQSARIRFIQTVYKMMNLISFFTVGPDEVRSWTIKKGATASHAAGKIHSDMERGFIRAEVVSYNDFIQLGTMAKARGTAKLRQEGKDYIVQDGDIIEFKFNV